MRSYFHLLCLLIDLCLFAPNVSTSAYGGVLALILVLVYCVGEAMVWCWCGGVLWWWWRLSDGGGVQWL